MPSHCPKAEALLEARLEIIDFSMLITWSLWMSEGYELRELARLMLCNWDKTS